MAKRKLTVGGLKNGVSLMLTEDLTIPNEPTCGDCENCINQFEGYGECHITAPICFGNAEMIWTVKLDNVATNCMHLRKRSDYDRERLIIRNGIKKDWDWSYLGAVLANESSDEQIEFLKSFVKECKVQFVGDKASG